MTAKQLYDNYQEHLKILQETCLHEKKLWAEEYWAPGHSAGTDVFICVLCNKVLDRKNKEFSIPSYSSISHK